MNTFIKQYDHTRSDAGTPRRSERAPTLRTSDQADLLHRTPEAHVLRAVPHLLRRRLVGGGTHLLRALYLDYIQAMAANAQKLNMTAISNLEHGEDKSAILFPPLQRPLLHHLDLHNSQLLLLPHLPDIQVLRTGLREDLYEEKRSREILFSLISTLISTYDKQ
ncbi:hypothetical protein CEXT_792691 [Caerostris extrusa]|uniref:Uncharacterized protein n=1 Tax=Caerostris extrusa TaxID=172846 RepID=A0AAV4NBA4_CAEEX|nr:hypothetical protein CEXT_792691 [Caerostris extrusa]